MNNTSNKELSTADQIIIVDELVTGADYRVIKISDIRISKTNRKRFDQTALLELAANIKANGLIQPILIRPVTPTESEQEPYEIVCGERRFRACRLAEIETINVIIRSMSDVQAAELQLIENLQREDPHPLEEAEGYQALMLQSGYTADMLAEKLSKSKSQIYARLKLCNLCSEMRDHFFTNKDLTPSLALLIARIPVPSLQLKAYEEIMNDFDGIPMSYRDAQDHIQTHYAINLKIAIFATHDAKLLPDAGSCKACSKRTGNDPDLADLEKDICTDPECYSSKVIAHHAQVLQRAEKNGVQIVEDDEAITTLKDSNFAYKGVANRDTPIGCFTGLKNKSDTHKKLNTAIGSDNFPEPIKYISMNNVSIAIYDEAVMQAMLEDLGFCYTKAELETQKFNAENGIDDSANDDENSTADQAKNELKRLDKKAEDAAELRAIDNEEIKRVRIYKQIRARGQLSEESLRIFMSSILQNFNFSIPEHLHEEFYGKKLSDDNEVREYIEQANSEQLQILLIDFVVGYPIEIPTSPYYYAEYLLRTDRFDILKKIAEAEGIDIATAEQEHDAVMNETNKVKPAIQSTKARKATRYSKPKADATTTPETEPAQEPSTPEQTATEAVAIETTTPKKRGRKSNADKEAKAGANPWPFPEPKTEGAN